MPRNWAVAPGAAVPDLKAQAKAAKAAAKALEAQRKALEKQAEKLREQSEKLKERADELKNDERSDSGARINELLAKAEATEHEAEARELQLAEIESQLDAVSDASEALEATAGENNDNGEDVTADLRAKAESNEKDGSNWFQLGFSLHNEGRYDEARKAFERSAELDFNRMQSIYNIACGYARQGNSDQAMAWLKKAWDAGFNDVNQYKNDADLESLRDDPRFEALISNEHTAP
jgi:tetratricopeptide (TPR) repeat protein